jgi:hypothetical protein
MLEALEKSTFEGRSEILRYFAGDANVIIAKKAAMMLEEEG